MFLACSSNDHGTIFPFFKHVQLSTQRKRIYHYILTVKTQCLFVPFQCIPLTFDKTVESVIQHLSLSCHGADTLRCRLDTVSTCLERDQRELSTIYQPTIDEMRDMTRRIVDTVTTAVHILSTIESCDRTDSEIGRRSSSSMSVPHLPDPSEIDLTLVHSQQQQQQQSVDENIRQKLSMVDTMEQQLEEKDKVIRDQHEVLQEYRAELFRLRESRRNATGQKLGLYIFLNTGSSIRLRLRFQVEEGSRIL